MNFVCTEECPWLCLSSRTSVPLRSAHPVYLPWPRSISGLLGTGLIPGAEPGAGARASESRTRLVRNPRQTRSTNGLNELSYCNCIRLPHFKIATGLYLLRSETKGTFLGVNPLRDCSALSYEPFHFLHRSSPLLQSGVRNNYLCLAPMPQVPYRMRLGHSPAVDISKGL